MTEDKEEWQELGARLKDAREYRGYSQQEVADCLDISRSSVSLIENGQRKINSLELQKLADFYDTSVDGLIEGPPEENDVSEEVEMVARAAQDLTPEDRQEVLRFANFLRSRQSRSDEDD